MKDIHGCETREDCYGGYGSGHTSKRERPESPQRVYEAYKQPVPPPHIQAILDRIRSKS